MKKLLGFLLTALLLFPILTIGTVASDDSPSFFFELSVDGEDTKVVQTGDIITVVLKLRRMDSDRPYTMYAMQNEVRYDSTFFEIVEGSAMLSDGVVSTDIAMVDQYREFYMNFLSISGGTQWNSETVVGSFQLRVVGESGVSQITNQDYIVSLQDGSGSYECQANELTIILSTDCTVKFMTNGGSEVAQQTVQYGERITQPENPVRDGYQFAGWYRDIHLTEEWDFEKDTVQGNTFLYAKWIAESVESDPVKDESTQTSSKEGWPWWLLLILLLALYIIKRIRGKEKG